jgi:prepilin-type N-terminal cleavage/methylation domain-containing protein
MRNHKKNEQGFSLIETVIVVGIISVLGAITLYQSYGTMESYRANSAMDVVVGQLRVARQLAVSQRRAVQVTFDVVDNPQTLSYQVMARPQVAGDVNGPIVTVPLPSQTLFLIEAGVPDTPMNFGTCGGSSAAAAVCIGGVSCCLPTMYFSSTGQFGADEFGTTPYNGTIFTGVVNRADTARGVTIMGSTGRVRPYTYVVTSTSPSISGNWTE